MLWERTECPQPAAGREFLPVQDLTRVATDLIDLGPERKFSQWFALIVVGVSACGPR